MTLHCMNGAPRLKEDAKIKRIKMGMTQKKYVENDTHFFLNINNVTELMRMA